MRLSLPPQIDAEPRLERVLARAVQAFIDAFHFDVGAAPATPPTLAAGEEQQQQAELELAVGPVEFQRMLSAAIDSKSAAARTACARQHSLSGLQLLQRLEAPPRRRRRTTALLPSRSMAVRRSRGRQQARGPASWPSLRMTATTTRRRTRTQTSSI